MPLSPWKNLNKLTNNSGSIDPSQVPASQIALNYQFQIDLTDELEFSTGDIKVVTVGADFLISGPDGAAVLEWSFSATYLAAQDEFGFSYYVSQQSAAVVQGSPKLLGDPDGISIPGGGTGESGADIIFETFESPVFVIAIPSGSTIKIVHHTAQYPALDDIEGLQVQTRPGSSVWATGFRHSLDGEAVILYSGTGGAGQVRAVGRDRTLTVPEALGWGEDTPIYLTRARAAVMQIAVYGQKGNMLARVSTSEGASYLLETVYTGYTPVGTASQDGEVIALVTNAAGAAFTGYRSRSGDWSDPQPANLPVGVKIGPGVLMATDGGELDFFWADTSGNHLIHSANDGKDWT